ncbi:MAG: hypothetical protein HOD63_04705 [Bacteroidetes bacterium]|jgi:hypothetical protein|nr:hypothetical protein [Bacteroidota bacterium]MBT5530614.1 hypothetical protein [Cytophagia bacterium]MBT3424534.1 hypothetical protein [Bacteroidota bacterium]MBT3802943.1 hypothetical protein [Bacteroidota bacterium]MBT3934746.1 hypothetical protein [Bacteroidota bacterium]
MDAHKEGWKLKRDSLSKLLIYFKDGNVRTLWSLDWNHRYSKVIDRNIGIARFHKKIMEYGSKAGVAIIYDKHTGKEIEKYFEGNLLTKSKA